LRANVLWTRIVMGTTNVALMVAHSSAELQRLPSPLLDYLDHLDHQDHLELQEPTVHPVELVDPDQPEPQVMPEPPEVKDPKDHPVHPDLQEPALMSGQPSSLNVQFPMPTRKNAHPTWNRCVDPTKRVVVENCVVLMVATWLVSIQLSVPRQRTGRHHLLLSDQLDQ